MARAAGLLILFGIVCLARDASFIHGGVGPSRSRTLPRLRRVPLRAGSEKLEVGAVLSATVKTLGKFGATLGLPGVDLPGRKHAFIHISQLGDGYTDKVEDVLSVGQQINVRVREVRRHDGRVEVREL